MAPHQLSAHSGNTLPPLHVLQGTLRKTTERLARELAAPHAQAPQWSDFEWHVAEAAAVMQGFSALLANRLRWRGAARWTAFLEQQKLHTSLRRARIETLLDDIDAAARELSLPVLALKGAALCRGGLYPQGGRPMSDIDLLVAPENVPTAIQVVTAVGYRAGAITARHLVFEPESANAFRGFGEHIDHPIKIELHARLSEHLPVREVDITALTLAAGTRPGLNFYPSLAAMMRHLLLHTAANLRARAMRGLQLHDIAALACRMSTADWKELARDGERPGAPWWMLAPLSLTASYYPSAIPQGLIESSALGCPPLLRRAARNQTLTDVSWSKLRIQAFPGIEWCHSVPEALRFMASRAFPDRAMRHSLLNIATKHSYSTATSWYGLSQGRRILRWVLSSPPRVQAIYPIRVALGLQPP